jgi:hypothetical protein
VEHKRERRREPRIRLEEALKVTPLGPPGGPPVTCVTCDLSGSGLRILSPRPFPSGSLVKMESPTRLLLAEVLRSDPATEGYHVALLVREVLLYAGLEESCGAIMRG